MFGVLGPCWIYFVSYFGPSAAAMAQLDGVRALSAYDGLILDQFGVLHDGSAPLPGVLDALRSLADAGVPCVILSNYGGPGDTASRKLEAMGFDAGAFRAVITSGMMTRLSRRAAGQADRSC